MEYLHAYIITNNIYLLTRIYAVITLIGVSYMCVYVCVCVFLTFGSSKVTRVRCNRLCVCKQKFAKTIVVREKKTNKRINYLIHIRNRNAQFPDDESRVSYIKVTFCGYKENTMTTATTTSTTQKR